MLSKSIVIVAIACVVFQSYGSPTGEAVNVQEHVHDEVSNSLSTDPVVAANVQEHVQDEVSMIQVESLKVAKNAPKTEAGNAAAVQSSKEPTADDMPESPEDKAARLQDKSAPPAEDAALNEADHELPTDSEPEDNHVDDDEDSSMLEDHEEEIDEEDMTEEDAKAIIDDCEKTRCWEQADAGDEDPEDVKLVFMDEHVGPDGKTHEDDHPHQETAYEQDINPEDNESEEPENPFNPDDPEPLEDDHAALLEVDAEPHGHEEADGETEDTMYADQEGHEEDASSSSKAPEGSAEEPDDDSADLKGRR